MKLAALDWVGVVLGGALALALFAFPLVSGIFAGMFRDLAASDLPLVTRLALAPWFSIAIGLLVCGGDVLGVFAARTTGARRALWGGSLVVGAAAVAFCVVAMYWPIFAVAGKVR